MLLKIKYDDSTKKVVFKPEFKEFRAFIVFLSGIFQRSENTMVIFYVDDDGETTSIKDQIDLDYFLHQGNDKKFLEIEVRPSKPEQNSDDFIDISEIPKHDYVKILESFTNDANTLQSKLDDEFGESSQPKHHETPPSAIEKSANQLIEIADQTLTNSDPNLLLSQTQISIGKSTESNCQTLEGESEVTQSDNLKGQRESYPPESFKKSDKRSRIRNSHGEHKADERKHRNHVKEKDQPKQSRGRKLIESIASKINFKKEKAPPEQPKVEFKCSNCSIEDCGSRIMFCMVCSFQLCNTCHSVIIHEHPMLVKPHPVTPAFIVQLQHKYEKIAIQRKFLLQNVKYFSESNRIPMIDNNHSIKIAPNSVGDIQLPHESDIGRERLTEVIANGRMTAEQIIEFNKLHAHENTVQFLKSLENQVQFLNNKSFV
jgi:hypothetical protein